VLDDELFFGDVWLVFEVAGVVGGGVGSGGGGIGM